MLKPLYGTHCNKFINSLGNKINIIIKKNIPSSDHISDYQK